MGPYWRGIGINLPGASGPEPPRPETEPEPDSLVTDDRQMILLDDGPDYLAVEI